MDNSEQKKVTIYSYSKVWKVEKRIYAIQNLVLPVPIDPWQLLYFGITWAAINLTFGALPGFSSIPVVIRSILIPYLISKFLLTKKLDGKNPIRYMIGIVMFLFCSVGFASAQTMMLEYDGGTHEYKGEIYALVVNNQLIDPPLSPIIFNDSLFYRN